MAGDEAPAPPTRDQQAALAQTTGLVRGAFNPAKRGIATPPQAKVLVIPVNDAGTTKYGLIDDWQANFIERRLNRAKSEKYDLVVLEIDTNGGFVDACEHIDRALANCPVPAVAYVTGKAFSGGALIALGCRAIVMAPGSQIGGALAVSFFGALPAEMRQKVDSEMRASVANLCDLNQYPHVIAQGMVDSNMAVLETKSQAQRFMTDEQLEHAPEPKPTVIRTWKPKGQILTLTANEARDVGLASGIAADFDDLLLGFSVNAATIERAEVTVSEAAARVLSNALWRVLLVLVALVALFIELKSPGHGMGYLGFAFCMGVFFWLQVFANSAGLAEIIMFGAGALLVAIELFLLPTFGALGFAGFVLVLASIVLAFFPEGSLASLWPGGSEKTPLWQMRQLEDGIQWAAVTLVLVIAFIITVWAKGVKLPMLRRLALHTENPATVRSAGPTPAGAPAPLPQAAFPGREWIGHTGVVETVLRPTGKVRIGAQTLDAVSEGGFLDAGTPVVVLGVAGSSLLVRQA